jgi:hypothetical protein
MNHQPVPTNQFRFQVRMIGLAGLASVLLLFGGQGFMQAGGTAEPVFRAPAEEIQRYFQSRDQALFSAGAYLELLGLLAMLWFICGLYVALRSRANQLEWMPTVALGSGVAMVGCLLVGSSQLAAFRVPEGLDPQLGRFAFDMGNLGFANAWVAMGSFALATGVAVLASRSLPGWLGWWVLVCGIGLIAARAVWTTSVWFFPYALFWLWVLVVSVRFLTGGSPSRAAADQQVIVAQAEVRDVATSSTQRA